jgi:hypothetical protein
MEPVIVTVLLLWALARYGVLEVMSSIHRTESTRISERNQREHERGMARDAMGHERAMARMAGKTGPSVTEALGARIAERIAHPRGATPPGPGRQAAAQWWDDAWGDATDRRWRHRERAARGELPRQKTARAAKEWLTGKSDQPRTAQPGTTQPGQQQRPDQQQPGQQQPGTTQPGQQQPGQQQRPAGKEQSSWPDPDQAPARVWADAQVLDRPADTASTGPGAGVEPDVVDAELVDPDPPALEPVPAQRPFGADLHGWPTPGQHNQHDTGDQMASVHPIRKDNPTMSSDVTSGETLDPGAALRFIHDIKGLAGRMGAQIEQSIAALSARGVRGEPIELLTRMQEAAQVMTGSCETAAGHFERHLATQDTVLADDTLAGTVHDTYVGTRS